MANEEQHSCLTLQVLITYHANAKPAAKGNAKPAAKGNAKPCKDQLMDP